MFGRSNGAADETNVLAILSEWGRIMCRRPRACMLIGQLKYADAIEPYILYTFTAVISSISVGTFRPVCIEAVTPSMALWSAFYRL